ncbi:hypothetical protein ACJJTC_012530 [Scirpophaga incertulas]
MSQRRNNRTNPVLNNSNPERQIDLDGAIKECVRFIVCREGSKIPIKRAEIVKHLSSTYQLPKNQVNSVIVEANRKLKEIYGYKLVQVEAKSGIQYIVVLTEDSESLLPTSVDVQQRKLLIASLTHIFMAGGSVKDDDMWKFLAEANLLQENDHAGRKLLTNTFTRQMYLNFVKEGDGELARNIFEWGQRAVEEVPKRFLLNKMAQAFDKTPDYWCEQYKEATTETAEEI